jgi:hypothetical protein
MLQARLQARLQGRLQGKSSAKMHLQTISHATLLVSPQADAPPVLATDPWLVGSCYWRSWWLSNPPDAATIERVAQSRYVYITHEHPDHLHIPSLRRIAPGPTILVPDFLDMEMDGYLAEELGFEVRRLAPETWIDLGAGVQVMSLPYPSNDSVLLVDTPTALLIDLNDVKPVSGFLDRIGQTTRAIEKPRLVLRSYSLAGPACSYFVEGARKPRIAAKNYISAALQQSRVVGGDYFVPFASQAVFRRKDSAWANDFKVDYAALRHYWTTEGPTLLPPYISMDLESFDYTAPDPRDYASPAFTPTQQAAVEQAVARDRNEELSAQDVAKLRAILNEERFAMLMLFRRGVAFQVGARRLVYDPRWGRLRDSDADTGVEVRLPLGPFRDAVAYGHFSDLFIGLFGTIHMDHEDDIDRFELLYKILLLRDNGYGGLLKRLRWALWTWRRLRPRVPLPPQPA